MNSPISCAVSEGMVRSYVVARSVIRVESWRADGRFRSVERVVDDGLSGGSDQFHPTQIVICDGVYDCDCTSKTSCKNVPSRAWFVPSLHDIMTERSTYMVYK